MPHRLREQLLMQQVPMRRTAGLKSVLFPAPFALALLLAGERPAQAVVTFNIFEESGNVYLETSGSLNLPAPSTTGQACDLTTAPHGGLASLPGIVLVICVGNSIAGNSNGFPLVAPSPYPSTIPFSAYADASSGLPLLLFSNGPYANAFFIDPSYINGTPITSSSTFLNKTLGLTTPGPIGTWTIDGTTETIDVVLGKPVPGPLPILGAGAAYSWSRRLRRRISAKI